MQPSFEKDCTRNKIQYSHNVTQPQNYRHVIDPTNHEIIIQVRIITFTYISNLLLL